MSKGPPFLLLITDVERSGVVHASLHPATLATALSHAEAITVRGDSPNDIGAIVSGALFMFKGPVVITEDVNVPLLEIGKPET